MCLCVCGVHPPTHASVSTMYTSKAGRWPAAVPVVSAVNLTIVLSKDECVHAAKTKHIEEVPGGWTHPETRMPNIQLKPHLFRLDFNYFVYVLYIFACLFFSAWLCKLYSLFILSLLLLLNQRYIAWQPAYIYIYEWVCGLSVTKSVSAYAQYLMSAGVYVCVGCKDYWTCEVHCKACWVYYLGNCSIQ